MMWPKRPPDFVIGDDYLCRWWLIPRNRWLNIYLHHIKQSDDDRALHDHPWANVSIILKGSYREQTPSGIFFRPRWSVIFRRATTRHRLLIKNGYTAWTLFITGPKIREWGFWCPQGFVPWRKFTDIDGKRTGPGCGD